MQAYLMRRPSRRRSPFFFAHGQQSLLVRGVDERGPLVQARVRDAEICCGLRDADAPPTFDGFLLEGGVELTVTTLLLLEF